MKTQRQGLWLPVLLLVVLAALCSPRSLAQETARIRSDNALSYAFISPNTRENLTLAAAINELASPEEAKLIAEAQYVGCRLRLRLRVRKAVGSWADGAEHSTVLRATTNAPRLRYAAAWLGKYARQKAVLYFRRSRLGHAKMYILLLDKRRDMAAVGKELDSSGVNFRTLAPSRKRLLVYIVDLKSELKAKVLLAARRLRARSWSIRGDGGFIGDENNRDKAQEVYDQEIKRYEATRASMREDCPK
jgi:hypothetical protein